MIFRLLNWRTFFFLMAIVLVGATLFYTRYLSKKIEREERQRVAEWIAATKALATANDPFAIEISNLVIHNNEDIPLIATDSKGNIIDYHNLDSAKLLKDPNYLNYRLAAISRENDPLEWELPLDPKEVYYVYFGKTLLQKEVQYYPIVQLILVGLFVALLIALISTRNRSAQNQVWAGMAKETAHQLGTPLTSLQGWLEVLRDKNPEDTMVAEMEKDLNRLKLVSERFGKIGSTPQLEQYDLVKLANDMVNYMKRRAPGRVVFEIHSNLPEIPLPMSATLLEWVLENLLKMPLTPWKAREKLKLT